MKRIDNAKSFPKVYYGLHMAEGVAEYAEPGKDAYRILILENALKTMDPTYAGKPVYVQHVDEVDLTNIQNEADGYVMESFFNPPDGKHWTKFIVVSDAGHEAIRRGWKLSNSYIPQSTTEGGEWHGVSYQREITAGEYEHLAIVPNPRYTESVIMTPEEFKLYNEDKKAELERLSNSKDEKEKTKMGKLNFFKRSKVDNAIDQDACIVLPKSGREITIEAMVTEADAAAVAKKKNEGNGGLADMSHKVKLHDGTYCNVGELLEKHKALNDELEEMKAKKDDTEESEGELETEQTDLDVEGDDKSVDSDDDDDMGDPEAKEKTLELAEHEDEEIEAAKKKKNAADKALAAILAKKKNAGKDGKKRADDLAARRAAKEKADKLRNAHHRGFEDDDVATVELMADQIQRGKQRYGSN
jgi:hypothetical protein